VRGGGSLLSGEKHFSLLLGKEINDKLSTSTYFYRSITNKANLYSLTKADANIDFNSRNFSISCPVQESQFKGKRKLFENTEYATLLGENGRHF
jgi:hypothetical protein